MRSRQHRLPTPPEMTSTLLSPASSSDGCQGNVSFRGSIVSISSSSSSVSSASSSSSSSGFSCDLKGYRTRRSSLAECDTERSSTMPVKTQEYTTVGRQLFPQPTPPSSPALIVPRRKSPRRSPWPIAFPETAASKSRVRDRAATTTTATRLDKSLARGPASASSSVSLPTSDNALFFSNPSRFPSTTSPPSSRLNDRRHVILSHAIARNFLHAFITLFVHFTWHNRTTQNPPSTAFTCYVKHVITTTALPVPVLITSLILVSRLKQRRPDLRGEAGSECRIFIAALAIAMKLLMDNTFSARTWEKVASIPVADLNVMEMEFLGQIDFETHVGEAEYFTWLGWVTDAVVKMHADTVDVAPPPPPTSSQPAPVAVKSELRFPMPTRPPLPPLPAVHPASGMPLHHLPPLPPFAKLNGPPRCVF